MHLLVTADERVDGETDPEDEEDDHRDRGPGLAAAGGAAGDEAEGGQTQDEEDCEECAAGEVGVETRALVGTDARDAAGEVDEDDEEVYAGECAEVAQSGVEGGGAADRETQERSLGELLVLVGRKTLEPNTAKELLAYMKTKVVKMAHPGVGATGHLATSLLAQEAKVTVDHIPYRGAAPALQDIAGGHVDLFFATPQSVVEQVASGQMKAYGITAKDTSPQFPTAASFVQELGPKLEILYWHALFAPAGTPDAVVEKLNAALQEIMADPAIVKSWADTGVVPYPKDRRSPAAARALLKSEIARWGQVVRDNNIQAQMQ